MKNDKWTACGPLKEEVRDSDGNLICKSRAPNSALIAAAPELLAALEALCAWYDHPALTGLDDGAPVASWAPSFDETVKMIHAAIAKAKGEL